MKDPDSPVCKAQQQVCYRIVIGSMCASLKALNNRKSSSEGERHLMQESHMRCTACLVKHLVTIK